MSCIPPAQEDKERVQRKSSYRHPVGEFRNLSIPGAQEKNMKYAPRQIDEQKRVKK